MTRYLADTHIAIWLLDAPEKLNEAQRRVLASDTQVFLSMASMWEMAIKASLGKLNPPLLMAETFRENGFDILQIQQPHVELLKVMPFIDDHRDPFDRMLIAQSMVEGLTLLSSDRRFTEYQVSVV